MKLFTLSAALLALTVTPVANAQIFSTVLAGGTTSQTTTNKVETHTNGFGTNFTKNTTSVRSTYTPAVVAPVVVGHHVSGFAGVTYVSTPQVVVKTHVATVPVVTHQNMIVSASPCGIAVTPCGTSVVYANRMVPTVIGYNTAPSYVVSPLTTTYYGSVLDANRTTTNTYFGNGLMTQTTVRSTPSVMSVQSPIYCTLQTRC